MTDAAEIAKLEAEIAQIQKQLGDDPPVLECSALHVEDEAGLQTEIKKLEREIKAKSPGVGLDRKRKMGESPSGGAGPVLYCTCRKSWDQTVPMIQCDVCEEWYHLRCIGMLSTEATCIDYYCCLLCQKKRKKNKPITRYKTDEKMEQEINNLGLTVVQREIALVEAELAHLVRSLPPPPIHPTTPAHKTSKRTPRALASSTPRTSAAVARKKSPAPSTGKSKSSRKSRKPPTPASQTKKSKSNTNSCRNTACRLPLLPEAKFCMECGTKVALCCSGCGANISASARFCSECGSAQ